MKRLRQSWPWLALALVGLVAKCQYDRALRTDGARDLAQQQLIVQRDSLSRLLAGLAVAYRVDTIVLRETVKARKPVIDTVTRWLTDTVPVPVEVVREIVRVDSVVIAACFVSLRTCEAEKEALRADLVLSQRQTVLWREKAQPSLWQQLGNSGKWLAIGYVLGRVY
jgi:hypothetical protein